MLKVVICFCLVATTLSATIPQKEQDLSQYVVGGRDTDISEIPFQVSMYYKDRFCCGGSIITPTHIVTAAHCTEGKNATLITFRAGSNKFTSGGVVVRAKTVHAHPKYDSFSMTHDVAVVELEESLNFSKVIQPISLASQEPLGEELVQSSGWGLLEEYGDLASTLQSVILPVVDRTICKEYLQGYAKITKTMVCAGVEGKDTCQGDSGGPLTSNKKLAGIVSFGVGCARRQLPGVYTNVAHPEVTAFIKTHANLNY